ncbi:MAG: AAA family ATPase [Rhodobacteraceae bacterium]|nr:AAA family ATPase [Paracoccaceae bacterium]
MTFHQSYAYEDFVEGIRPVTENGAVTYEVRPGVLKRLCDRARRAPDKRFALFIDEINRGNVAKIFGELITLVEVDKRIRIDASGNRLASCKGLEVTLPYSGERFGVPANVDVIGTMNTADRSIALLDSALRRRFRFEELTPKPELLESIDDSEGNAIDLRQLLQAMNARLSRLLHRDQTLGHSYFYHVKSFDELRRVFAREILPFLQEAFYDDWRQIRYVLADQAVEEELQLVRARTQNAAVLFPKADPTEIGTVRRSRSFEKMTSPRTQSGRSTSHRNEVPDLPREGGRQHRPGWRDQRARAEGIAKLAGRLPPGVLAWSHRSLKFGPFCGVLQTEQLAIEILPKIDHGSDSSEDMRGLLVAMLARAGELGSKRVGDAGLGQQHSHLLDIFIEDFCSQVKSALRGGAIARYTERTENLNAIPRRLELTEHLRTNAFDRSHLLCRFDERSIDNPYNQALKAVLRILLGLALSPRTRAVVAAFLHRFDEVTDRRVTARDVGALRFDRTIRHWSRCLRGPAGC